MQALGAIGAGAAINPVSSAAADVGSYYQSVQDTLTGEEGLPGGDFVYADNASDTIAGFEVNNTDVANVTRFQASGQPFTDAVRIENPTETENAYATSFMQDITGRTIEDGDVLLAVVYLRGEVPGDVGSQPTTNVGFKYRYQDGDSTGYSSNSVASTTQVNPGSEWKQYYFPIEVTKPDSGSDFQPYLEFWTGYGPQTLEFGGMALLDYSGTDVAVGDLPITEFSYDYEGRAEDAAWREEAEQRIDDLRKTDFEVSVVGPDGNPVEGADVNVEMSEHEFPFGTAASLNNMGAGDSGNAQYESVLLDRFNKVTIENGLKAPYWNEENAVETLDWLNEQEIPVRGHALFWGQWEWMLPPESAGLDEWPDGEITRDQINWSDDRILEEVRNSIENRATAHDGQVVEWDMENHPIMFPQMQEYFGEETVREWWNIANEADTDAGMVINDMQVLGSDSQLEAYHEHISGLVDNDVGIDAVGFMAHFGLDTITPPTEVWDRLDRFAELGLDLQITEFDVQINDRTRGNEVDAQTDYVRDFLTACFAHEAMDTFISWGFWPGDHWRPTAAYYNQDWSLRKHGQQYMDLVFDEWWTDVEGATDANGAYADRAFKGDHVVTAAKDGWYGRAEATFDDENGSVEVQVAPVDVGDIELSADATDLTPGDESDLGVTVTSPDGTQLPLGDVTYESSDESVLTVSEQGVVTAEGGGEATVTVTAPAFRDTAVASVAFSVTSLIEDDLEDLSKAHASSNVSALGYNTRHGDSSFLQQNDTSQPGTVTYRLEEGIDSYRMVGFVNSAGIDDFVFEASSDGSSFEEIDYGSKDVVPGSSDNGYYAKWTYTGNDLPEDATYLRVTLPGYGGAGYQLSVGSVSVSSAADTFGGSGGTGGSGAYGTLAVDDPATDLSKVTSSTAMEPTTYETRYDQGTRLRKSDTEVDSHLTYRVDDTISAFRVTGIVNSGGAGDFSDFAFAVSSDGQSFEEIEYGTKSTVAGDDSNGYYGQWTYLTTENIPEDARYLRVTLPPIPTGNGWAVNVGTVKVWTGDAGGGARSADNTGPVVVVDGLSPATYNGAPAPSTSVADPDTEVTSQSFTLDGEAWTGGAVRERGEHTFGLSATNADDATTETEFGFETVHDTTVSIENRRGRPGRPPAFVITLTDAVTDEGVPGHPVTLWADGKQVTTEDTYVDGKVTLTKGELFSQVSPKGGDIRLRAVYDGEDTDSLNGSEAETTVSPGNGNGNGNGN